VGGKFLGLHGRYGTLADITDWEDGLPANVAAGKTGSYTLSIELKKM
jgi:hypothetical protein